MQNVLDFVYNFLVTNFPNNHKLWDMKSVRKWGGQPASDAQKRLIYRNRKKLSDLDIDYDKLTKYEASVIINRIHNWKGAYYGEEKNKAYEELQNIKKFMLQNMFTK